MSEQSYIKSIFIKGFKKFREFDMAFNNQMNIFVGENEVGKSTVLNAIKLVLNQDYRYADKAVLEDLFNVDLIKSFKENPSIENLPKIYIELELELNPSGKNAEYFWGEHNLSRTAKYGISFTCEFDEELGCDIAGLKENSEIPYEYYMLRWNTFSGMPYNLLKKPLTFLFLNTSEQGRYSSFNYYTRNVFENSFSDSQKLEIKNRFRNSLKIDFGKIDSVQLENDRVFGIDSKKVILENILSIFAQGVSLENHGSGMESLIKTEIALNRKDEFNVVLMEEPENHLSFTNMQKMISIVSQRNESSQLFIATHSSMIASRLDLRNVFWITEGQAHSLQNVAPEVATFFTKAVNNNFLQLLLSKKVILVEGPTEFLLVPEFYEQETGKTIFNDQVTIISCNGISYKKYLQIAEHTDKRIAVLTDNDKNENGQIQSAAALNSAYKEQKEKFRIFMAQDANQWTWEVCLYHSNEAILKEFIESSFQKEAAYKYNGEDYGPYIGYMLNHKADFAFEILNKNLIRKNNLKMPDYVKEAIQWVSE